MSRHSRSHNPSRSTSGYNVSPAAKPTSPAPVQTEQKLTYTSFQFWIIFFFHMLVLTVPLFFTWVNEELFEFNKIILVYAFTLIIGSLWLGRMIVQKKIIWKKTIFDFPILFFLISQLLSTIFSINFHTSIFGYYTRFNGGLLSTISYIILFYAFVNNVEKKYLSRFFFTTFLSAFLVTLMAIPEHFGHSFSCLLIGVSRGEPISGSIYNTTCWIQDVKTRVFASFGQPNWLAAYAITLMPLGALLASGHLDDKFEFKIPTWQRCFYALTTFTLLLTLIFTKSRSGLVGLAIGLAFGAVLLLVYAFLTGKFKGLSNQGKIKSIFNELKKPFIISQIILAILAVAFFGTEYTPTIQDVLTHHHEAPAPVDTSDVNRLDEGGTDSGEIRRIVWTGAIKVWERYPILGSGVETFAYSYYKDRPMEHNLVSEWDFLYNKAHNEFLNYLATTGIVGLLTYLLFLGAATLVPILPLESIQFFYKKKLSSLNVSNFSAQQRDWAFLIGLALSSGLVALSVSNFFGFSTVMVSALTFLFPGIWWVFIRPHTDIKPDDNNVNSLSMTQVVLLCLLFFVALAFLFHVYEMWEADHIFSEGKQNSEADQVNVGLPLLEQAVAISPDEPYYYEELAVTDARVAAALGANNEATEAADFAQRSIDVSNQMIAMNPVNLNFYKSQAQIYSLLAELDPRFLQTALQVLAKARVLAPTDPKLVYNMGLIEVSDNMEAQGIKDLQEAIVMKSNYLEARDSLAAEYEKAGNYDLAKAQYEYILQNIQPADPTSLDQLKFIATSSAKPATKK